MTLGRAEPSVIDHGAFELVALARLDEGAATVGPVEKIGLAERRTDEVRAP